MILGEQSPNSPHVALPWDKIKFTEQYPEMDVSLLMSDEAVNLLNRTADLAVRVKKPTQSNFIFKKFVNLQNCKKNKMFNISIF